MVLSSPLHEETPAPSLAYLVCAACCPVSELVLQQAGICLEDEPRMLREARRCEVTPLPPFATLKRWVAENEQAREALATIERSRKREGKKLRPVNYSELTGRARTALLLGRGKDFERCYKAYVRDGSFLWHPDPEHMLFWDRVLGPGWTGSDAVPEGEARQEIVQLTAAAFAFFPLPLQRATGSGVCGAPAREEWLEVAYALRVADGETLDALMLDGSDAGRAGCELLGGVFELAQQDFERIFGRAEELCYSVVQNMGLPLLLYALLGGVLCGGNLRFLRGWLTAARYGVQYSFPPSMGWAQAELMNLLDNLELVDSLVNRGGVMNQSPPLQGALACLPFAMAYGALPAYVRREVEANGLAEAVLQLEQAGQHLLARYGAAGLHTAEALRPERRAQLEALLEESGFVMPPMPAPYPLQALEALRALARKTRLRGGELEASLCARPPVLVASRMPEGVAIALSQEAEAEEYDNSAALRCMKRYAPGGTLVLEGASPAEFTRLFTALQTQVDVVGSLALPDEPAEDASPAVCLLLERSGSDFLAVLRLRLLPGAVPLMSPGCGLQVPVLEREDGRPVAVCRDMAAEWALVEQCADALCEAGVPGAGGLVFGVIRLSGFAELAQLLRCCRERGYECCWEKEHALRLYQPQAGLQLSRGAEQGGWLELGGGLPVDEGRVLELTALLEAFAGREGNALRLGAEEYLLLSPVLERQLVLLELVLREKQGKRGVAAAAIPLLEALEAAAPAEGAAQAAADIPPGLAATLRPYQQQGFRWLAERASMGLGGLLADDMGLGKTVQVLALLLHASGQPGAGPALVLAPVSLLGNWAEEAARFAPSLRVVCYEPRRPDCLAGLGAGTLVLASYGQVAARSQDFAALAWDVLVLDEAQAIKNPDSQRAKIVCTLRARSRFCLTGTPVENSLLDLWSQMRFLNPGLFGTRAAFQRRFRKAAEAEFALLRQVLAPIVLRRSKAEVLTQLPPLTETIEWVEFSREERALYESLRRAAVARLGQGGGAGDISMLAELTRLRRACCHGKLALEGFSGSSAKLLAMQERVEELRAAGRRVLIFSQFTDVLDLAQQVLQEAGIRLLRLDGSTPAAQRNKAVKAFQQGQADAFLISLKAGGAGLNLTAADYVMLLDPWWNPAVEAQAAGRSHRMGQQQPVTLCRFMVRDTVEERILSLHKEKKELAENVFSGSSEALTLANLRALLG